VWFVISFTGLIDVDHRAYSAWVSSPLNATLMIALVVSLFTHMGLGLQVIVEDYVHADRPKRFAIVTLQLGCAGLAIASGVAIFRMLT
jgi:succinate dehydrogenase / fumarate reductase membrane anchor subunit